MRKWTVATLFPKYIYQVSSMLIFLSLILVSRPALHLYQKTWLPEVMLAAGMVFSIEISGFIRELRRFKYKTLDVLQSISVPSLTYLCAGFSAAKTMKSLMLFSLLGSIYIGGLILINRGSSVEKSALRVLRGISTGLFNLRAILTIFLSIALVGTCADIQIMGFSSDRNMEQSPEIVSWSEDRTISGRYQKDKLYLLEEEAFIDTDIDTRMELFTSALDTCANSCNIPFRVKTDISDLSGGVAAEYSEKERTVYVDRDFLLDCTSKQLLHTAFHELKHCIQHREVDAYLRLDLESRQFLKDAFDSDVETLIDEFTHYKQPGYEYSTLYCEADCESFAEYWYDTMWSKQFKKAKEEN